MGRTAGAAMTRRFGQSPRRPTQFVVSSRSDWRRLISLARQCAADARGDSSDDEAELRLMTLRRQTGTASWKVLDRDAGACVADCGVAFLRISGAFTRPSAEGETRTALAPILDATAAFLDDQLHALATDDFNRAHAGRPEVWG